MALEQTSQIKEKTKLGYDQILAETAESNSSSTRAGAQGNESRTDINRTSESTQTGSKEQVSNGESKSERKVDTQNATARTSVERVNLGFRLSFSIPLTGIIPTNSPGTSC